MELKEADVKDFIKEGKVVIKACASDMKCGYCDKFCPTFEEASKLYPDVKFGSIAVPMKDPVPSEFKRNYMKGEKVDGKAPFLGTPTTVLFENGEMKARLVGNQTLDVLKKFIETGETPPPAPQKQRTIQDMSVMELKAMAYDQLAAIESAQKNLNILNQLIAEKSNANGR